ncbi:glycosyltransferase [bacterium]|nr:glycosyltransferase [bacterium]MBU1634361.1 glycosyltransferase [bacterium]MBU1900947.1 glycosyltransferase [Patescibacteria group bacterium]
MKSTNKTKLCFVSLGSYPLFNPKCDRTFGGAEIQMYLLAKELSKNNDFELSFIVGDFGQEKIEKYGKISVYSSIKPNSKRTLFSKLYPRSKILLLNLLRKIRPDIVIQRSASAGTGMLCFFAHLFGAKFIYMSAHEIDCNGGYEKQNNWLIGKFFQYGIRHADLVVTQSKEHQQMIKECHRKESLVMPSMYEIPNESIIDTAKKDIILWVGRVEDWKQPDLFIELARHFPNERFIMIAPISNNQPKYYENLKRELSKVNNVEHIHYVPFKEIDNYFRRAKVYVLTSRYEGFPNTFVQAAKNKTPLLSFSVNPDGIIQKYNCGLFAKGDKKTLKIHLGELLSKREKREELAENAYQYARKRHDITRIAKEYSQILKRL